VKIVRDEEVVKKWTDDQSWKTEFVCLNMPEPLRLGSRDAVEKHFRETHKETIIKQVDSHTLGGVAARAVRSPGLSHLVRQAWEDQRRFPLQLATTLSQQFASDGLQFFKVNKAITHVSVARPSFLNLETTPVSEGIKRIVEFINAHPKSTRRKLMESLAPSPAPKPIPIAVNPETVATDTAAVPPAPAEAEPTPEQTAVISDLHWLIHQGHIIEFANGVIETAKKPLPKPPKPAKAETKAPEPSTETVSTDELAAVPDLSNERAPVAEAPTAETPVEPAAEPSSPEQAVSEESPVADHPTPAASEAQS
jgi:hypothetical protein